MFCRGIAETAEHVNTSSDLITALLHMFPLADHHHAAAAASGDCCLQSLNSTLSLSFLSCYADAVLLLDNSAAVSWLTESGAGGSSSSISTAAAGKHKAGVGKLLL